MAPLLTMNCAHDHYAGECNSKHCTCQCHNKEEVVPESKVKEILREYTAPLEDNYGKTTYDAVLNSIEIKIREAIAEEGKGNG